jgi:hypothetical protein
MARWRRSCSFACSKGRVMVDLKQDKEELFRELEKLWGVIASISKEKRQALIGLVNLEEERLKDLLVNDTGHYADTVPKYIGYLKELAYNIEHADERYQKLKEENTLDTLDSWNPVKIFSNIRGRDRDKAFYEMKLGINI